jgi:hypothetical protein
MEVVQWTLWVVGLSLQFLVLTELIWGGLYKEFPIIFGYTLILLITTSIDIACYLLSLSKHPLYSDYYWTAELIRQSGLFSVVISLVLDVMPAGERRQTFLRLVILAAVVFWFGSIVIHRNDHLNIWMTQVTRNLSFCSAIVNLILWFVMISTPQRDARRLMITGGLGLQMTGEAIGQSIRYLNLQISEVAFTTASILIVLAHFLCLYIWWQAFSLKYTEPASPATPLRHEVSQSRGL